jgi:hypothetical protein
LLPPAALLALFGEISRSYLLSAGFFSSSGFLVDFSFRYERAFSLFISCSMIAP